jgi:hypothetical protein
MGTAENKQASRRFMEDIMNRGDVGLVDQVVARTSLTTRPRPVSRQLATD